MNVKKGLEARIRGWFPQEPVLKASLKTQISPVNSNLSFKVRRWLHGFSAFVISLWCQRSTKFKVGVGLFGAFIFLNFLLDFLLANKLVDFYWFNFGWIILLVGYFVLNWVLSVYIKRKEQYKNCPNRKMSLRKTMENSVRGWLPKEPKLPTRTSSIQLPKSRILPKPVVRIARWMSVYAAGLSLLFAFSTLQIVLTVLAFSLGLVWFVSNRRVYLGMKKILKYCLIVTLAFIIVFSGVQFYVFETSGYPPTAAPQFSRTDLSSASLTQYLQNVEQSENFRLLQVNHFGTVTFERIELHSYGASWMQWTFHTRDTNSRITIGNTAGQPYYTDVDSLLSSVFPRQGLPTKDFSLQTVKESFGQIDNLGLSWLQKTAADIYENQTGVKPQVAALNVNVGFDNPNGYEGLTVFLSARSLSHDNRGTAIYPEIFEAEFQPNGTLLSFNNLTAANR